jgi:hypothetical protein
VDERDLQLPAEWPEARREEDAAVSRWWKAEPVVTDGPSSGAPEAFAKYAPLFLTRMYRLSLLRACGPLTPLQQRLVDHALYSTYWDCAGIDAREEAIDVMQSARRG